MDLNIIVFTIMAIEDGPFTIAEVSFFNIILSFLSMVIVIIAFSSSFGL